MAKNRKQLYILCDLEGASQISPDNRQAMHHSSELWQKDGRRFLTSDVLAICEAAEEFGIDEIIINDDHDSGIRASNLLVDQLPAFARVMKRPHLPGTQKRRVRKDALGMIIAGQHAMYQGGGFAPHTVESPPIEQVILNGRLVGEIGLELAMFPDIKLLAVFGEEAAVQEAKSLCPKVVGGAVKSLEKNWFPPIEETHGMIKEKTLEALRCRDETQPLLFEAPYQFSMRLVEGYQFCLQGGGFMAWMIRFFFFKIYKGNIEGRQAFWQTKDIVRGTNILYMIKMVTQKIPK